ncbi:hypothetical protein DL771_000548 [Monosporascus sp. 5C6A]|nr:hypothetical protein DL771_000548 [Monosporascus sp. 5C6A]
MATLKSKPYNPLTGMHTAGIFSDMSIDGPDIGTLVVIVDRAKNLPNRKTIGKQDPYAAARLGKEAKKTTTDIRGGQTPKWDQELRFTVHDSPDYYQLKLSVFNDDKRTDLIGETWIDLRDIIVQGGGQSDQWHSLNCKGKYAGEIRIEITYYDTRPKPEKPAAKPKSLASSSETDLSNPNGAQRAPIKRRPLPSDPVTGKVPSPAVHDDVQTPPRQKPSGPTAYVPNQPPPQPVEYNAPLPNRYSSSQPDLHAYAPPPGNNQYSTPPPRQDHQLYRSADKGDKYSPYEENHQYSPDPRQQHEADPRRSYHNLQEQYESPPAPVRHPPQPGEDDRRPPPPPAHRVRNNSGSSHEAMHRGSYDASQQKAILPMRHDVLRNEAHRLSISSPSSSYPGRPSYRPYESAPDVQAGAVHHGGDPSLIATPRHHSYDSAYDSHYRSMQPTVEDVPESWTPPKARTSISGHAHYDDSDYGPDPSPAPLSLTGRGRDPSGHHSSPVPVQNHNRRESNSYSPSASPMHARDYYTGNSPSHSFAPQNDHHTYTRPNEQYIDYPSELDNTQTEGSDSYAMALVPRTLVPGVDSALARNAPDPSYEERRNERRYTQPAPATTQPRGRQHSEPPVSNYAAHYSPHNYQTNHPVSYDQSLVSYSGGHSTPSAPAAASRSRGISPSPAANHTIRRKSVSPAPPNHTIRRKSVSPAPPPPDSRSDGRRLSGVPFGPDSYDELNPVVSLKDSGSNSQEYTNTNGKIVTPDGREVDPSDHLPMDTWAPEPEPKKPTAPATESRSRLTGAQPMPPSSRRAIRVTVRPQSSIAAPSQSYTPPEAAPPPASTGRNRLQKKQHRMPAAAAPVSSGASPLGPATAHKRNSTPPRALVRAGTFDYENYAPPSYGAPRTGHGEAPPIPAKVPMMSGGLGPTTAANARGTEEWALMEEMSRIDIGTGRARRHITYHP